VNWIHVKIRARVNGFEAGKNSRRGRRKAERASRFGRKRRQARRYVRGFAKQRTRQERREGEEERVSGWFIESLSGAVDLCAEEGAGGGAFI